MEKLTIEAANGNLIGTLRGNVLTKQAKKSIHMYRSIGARGSWGIDYDALHNKLPERCVIRIEEREEGITYQATAANWMLNGIVKHFKEGTKDHYTQVFLPLAYFDKTTPRI